MVNVKVRIFKVFPHIAPGSVPAFRRYFAIITTDLYSGRNCLLQILLKRFSISQVGFEESGMYVSKAWTNRCSSSKQRGPVYRSPVSYENELEKAPGVGYLLGGFVNHCHFLLVWRWNVR